MSIDNCSSIAGNFGLSLVREYPENSLALEIGDLKCDGWDLSHLVLGQRYGTARLDRDVDVCWAETRQRKLLKTMRLSLGTTL